MKSELETEEIFKLPICFNSKVKILNEHIIADLELKNINETDETNETSSKPIYNYVFNPTNSLGDKMLKILPTYYTTDTNFLKDNQQLLDHISYKEIDEIALNTDNITNFDIEETVNSFNEIKSETGFCEKYLYVDWDFAKFMNNNLLFLQFMSIYNIASPLLSLCLPIFVLIIPFLNSFKLNYIPICWPGCTYTYWWRKSFLFI